MKEANANQGKKEESPPSANNPASKKGSPLSYPPAKPAVAAAPAAPAAPPPPPPPHYFAYHGPPPPPPPNYEHLPPPSSDRPGPYTAAQYDVALRKISPPYGQPGSSPPSTVGRDPPPPHHYSREHPPPPRRPSSFYRDEHRHWPHPPPPPGEGPYPPRYYDSSYQNAQYPPPPPPPVDHLGPYRFSDPSLRRDAVSRLSNSDRLNDVDGREGATSPSQIELSHRDEVTTMGCTCKKTKCLKLYCQCFAVKIYCGGICRCLVCHNTSTFEKERKDAIRNILSRNPSAFDTKFKRSLLDKAVPDPSLAHKLGCKCRKSACMKKYCECYAGNVKCSASCRCVGCKNMPKGGLPPPPTSGVALTTRDSSSNRSDEDVEDSPNGKKSEPWMMNAAHNLAFLKHASPVAEKQPRRTHSNESGEPSLASEESPTTTNGMKTVSVAGRTLERPTSSEKTAVNALLMAAMAMTEMSGQDTEVSTPPTQASKPDGTQEDNFDTPQKNLLGLFKSPKRKQSTDEANPQDTTTTSSNDADKEGMRMGCQESSPSGATSEDSSPKREPPSGITPSNQQKVKRSRIGTLEKGPRNQEDELNHDHLKRPLFGTSDNKMETPQTKGEGKKQDLTPVSARCIDFRKMHVNESPQQPKQIEKTVDSME